jgi:hypothetical protein
VEDVFPVDDFVFFGPHRRTGNNKAWTNRLLENNPVPAIWVSNIIEEIPVSKRLQKLTHFLHH